MHIPSDGASPLFYTFLSFIHIFVNMVAVGLDARKLVQRSNLI